MNFDIRTLSIMAAVSSLVFAFAAFTVAHLVPRERHLRHWTWGSGLAALGTFLVGLRGILPDLVSAALANTAMVAAFTLMYIGTRAMVGLAPARSAVWLFAVCAFLGLAWFTAVDPLLFARILIVSLALIPLMGMTAVAFWRYDRGLGPTPLRLANRFTVLVFLLGVLLFVARLYPAMQNASSTSYLSSTSALLVAPYFWAILFNVWMSIMITLTVSARLQAELIDARDQAQANSVAKSQFLANISHEIRTPLNGVLGMAQIMDRGELAPVQREHLAIIRESGSTLLTLLNDVLDLAKIEAGKLEIQRDHADPGQIAARVCDTFQAMAREKGLALGVSVAPDAAGTWRIDPMRVQQVLANLVSNAVKFTARGEVAVEVWKSARGLEFGVRDSGAGIPTDRLQDLFGKFNQLDASTTRAFGGSGLGLAICRELVALMGGEMSVESQVGQGSVFSFYLPADKGQARAAA